MAQLKIVEGLSEGTIKGMGWIAKGICWSGQSEKQKPIDMKNKTCEDAADAIVANGAGKNIIIQTLKAVFNQGYSRGYTARLSDFRRGREAKRKAMDQSFKAEMDTIDDVIKSKWA